MSIEDRLKNLEVQLNEYKALYFKCEGAIEILKEILNDKSKD